MATHGPAVFTEHNEDARNRTGAYPHIDRLFHIQGGGAPWSMRIKER
ncbi:DUF2322 family protein [Litorisediminicola beolgyonensis]|uniref:DUF2322 family protein n=1 Tax=Litorisediminicola beolgyonensis TaxID=1173614 RepID=A0ABW3ZKP7_9RHOB